MAGDIMGHSNPSTKMYLSRYPPENRSIPARPLDVGSELTKLSPYAIGHPSTGPPADLPQYRLPIKFYHKHKPYYGFTNFSSHAIIYNGKAYPTSEHLFQSFKVTSRALAYYLTLILDL
jgi:diaminohydroxyphosphoribosylaminopyrimidine deaminase/5-amino-6-(5-phosphoribosylamino)uracil reductase